MSLDQSSVSELLFANFVYMQDVQFEQANFDEILDLAAGVFSVSCVDAFLSTDCICRYVIIASIQYR